MLIIVLKFQALADLMVLDCASFNAKIMEHAGLFALWFPDLTIGPCPWCWTDRFLSFLYR